LRRALLGVIAVAAVASAAFLPASTAQAAFPGNNGKIVFSGCPDPFSGPECDIYVVNPDGSGLMNLTNTPVTIESAPQWSPDGQKIVFNADNTHGSSNIFTMNADGTNVTQVTNGAFGCFALPGWSPDEQKMVVTYRCDPSSGNTEQINVMNADGTGRQALTSGAVSTYPSWSPDGNKIAFARDVNPYEIFSMNADGTGQTRLTITPTNRSSSDPTWSPDGGQIAFASSVTTDQGDQDIYTMDADGTDVTRLTAPSIHHQSAPAWSPDGTKIAFEDCDDFNDPNCWVGSRITVTDTDGMGATQVTPAGLTALSPDWQPLPINSYPRPKGATPVLVALTIAYEPCTTPDREHNPPLSAPSCSQHQMTSDYLTVGTGDANGMLPRSVGSVRYDAVLDKPATPADEADVKLQMSMSDVFTKALADYAGELSTTVAIQLTDRDNTPSPGGPGAATTQEFQLPFFSSCTPTADTTIGSDCAATTTANAVIPGLVKRGLRTIWQLGQVKVYDGGADGFAATTADNTLFADEGIFAP
jgi:dipeptidyl aminopeptidase/acylaminoacyl peptidase